VSHDLETYLGLLDRRLSLLRLLAQEFVDCRKEFVALDLDGMYRRISEQEELCRQIQRLHPAIQALQQTCATQIGLESTGGAGEAENCQRAERLGRVMRELGQTQAEVGRLNQVHAAYLRRSRRTINMFMNYMSNYAMSYSRPGDNLRPAPTTVEKG
jgi:flagellar FlgN protein